ncbi:hypothetical protein HanPSC8_Chr04g0151871 [Helianthus annuus]|nr:hypothetical protein HanPSC8_Chr04g0151871 [Helianthus annuus]
MAETPQTEIQNAHDSGVWILHGIPFGVFFVDSDHSSNNRG